MHPATVAVPWPQLLYTVLICTIRVRRHINITGDYRMCGALCRANQLTDATHD